MRRWLLDLHLYLGLLCLPYVVVFGVSSILLNHGIEREARRAWSTQIAPLVGVAPEQQAEAARGALGLSGHVLPHTLKPGDDGSLAFRLIRPGRSYDVAVSAGGEARVRERDGGPLGVVSALHGFSVARGALFERSWSLYTELATAALLFSIASGLGLFLPRPNGRALGLGAGVLGTLAAAALAAAIW
jgi:hypothetical protein